MVAKFFKIPVDVFSIGVGPYINIFKIKETKFRISLIPLGGYCKLNYGYDSDIKESNELEIYFENFYHKEKLKKILITFAGPFFNMAFAFLIFLILSMQLSQYKSYPSKIYVFKYNNNHKLTPAYKSKLKTGDKILSINNKSVLNFSDIVNIISKTNGNLNLKVQREDKILDITVARKSKKIGISPLVSLVVDKVNKKNEILGIKNGVEILSVNNKQVKNLYEFQNLLKNNNTYNIEYKKNNKIFKTKLIVDKDYFINFRTKTYKKEGLKFLPAVLDSLKKIKNMTLGFFSLLSQIFLGKRNMSDTFLGPIKAGYIINSSLNLNQHVLKTMSKLMALISFNLGITNLLPIPLLDGGQIVLILISAIFKNRFKGKFIFYIQIFGMLTILCMFSLVIFSDLSFLVNLIK